MYLLTYGLLSINVARKYMDSINKAQSKLLKAAISVLANSAVTLLYLMPSEYTQSDYLVM